MFILFMAIVLCAWLFVVAPATRDLGRLIGIPPGARLGGWLIAGLFGHDDQAEDICPQASWACAMGEARARTGWHAALTWAAAHPGPVLAGAGALVAAFWLPEYASLGAIVLVCPPVPGRLGVHGVPQEAWDRMAARWEKHPGEYLLYPRGVPCLCEYCGFLKNPVRLGDCRACGYCTGKVFPWVGPGNYWRSNGQASVALGPCDSPDELHVQLRESQGTGDWRGWHITHAPYPSL